MATAAVSRLLCAHAYKQAAILQFVGIPTKPLPAPPPRSRSKAPPASRIRYPALSPLRHPNSSTKWADLVPLARSDYPARAHKQKRHGLVLHPHFGGKGGKAVLPERGPERFYHYRLGAGPTNCGYYKRTEHLQGNKCKNPGHARRSARASVPKPSCEQPEDGVNNHAPASAGAVRALSSKQPQDGPPNRATGNACTPQPSLRQAPAPQCYIPSQFFKSHAEVVQALKTAKARASCGRLVRAAQLPTAPPRQLPDFASFATVAVDIARPLCKHLYHAAALRLCPAPVEAVKASPVDVSIKDTSALFPPTAASTCTSPAAIPTLASNSPTRESTLARTMIAAELRRQGWPCNGQEQEPSHTGSILAAMGYVPVETHVHQHCWWHASALHTGISVNAAQLFVLQRLNAQSFGLSALQCMALLSPTTSTEEVAMAVHALREKYLTGLLVMHQPGSGAFLFMPDSSYLFLSLCEARAWLRLCPDTHVMLYTCPNDITVGHYVPCLPLGESLQHKLPDGPFLRTAKATGMRGAGRASLVKNTDSPRRSRSPPPCSPTSEAPTSDAPCAPPPSGLLPEGVPLSASVLAASFSQLSSDSPPCIALAQTTPVVPASARTLTTVLDTPSIDCSPLPSDLGSAHFGNRPCLCVPVVLPWMQGLAPQPLPRCPAAQATWSPSPSHSPACESPFSAAHSLPRCAAEAPSADGHLLRPAWSCMECSACQPRPCSRSPSSPSMPLAQATSSWPQESLAMTVLESLPATCSVHSKSPSPARMFRASQKSPLCFSPQLQSVPVPCTTAAAATLSTSPHNNRSRSPLRRSLPLSQPSQKDRLPSATDVSCTVPESTRPVGSGAQRQTLHPASASSASTQRYYTEMLDWVFDRHPAAMCPDWSCLGDELDLDLGQNDERAPDTQDLLCWNCAQLHAQGCVTAEMPIEKTSAPQPALIANIANEPSSQEQPPPPPCPDPALFAVRVWQVQKLSPVPVP